MNKPTPMPVACFAPALTDEVLVKYRQLVSSATGAIGDALGTCLAAVIEWWELPESSRKNITHLKILHRSTPDVQRSEKLVPVVPLDSEHLGRLDEMLPWPHEIEAIEKLFDSIDPVASKELRDAAFHLLWHVKELSLGREPLTADALK